MKLTRIRRDNSIAFNMTPMIDIVFLLIIFFMTVSQITRTIDHPLNLPTVRVGSAESTSASVTINLNAQGEIILGGRKTEMQKTLQAIRSQLQKHDNDFERIRILIRCDRECQSSHINKLVKRLSDIGFTQVRVAVDDN